MRRRARRQVRPGSGALLAMVVLACLVRGAGGQSATRATPAEEQAAATSADEIKALEQEIRQGVDYEPFARERRFQFSLAVLMASVAAVFGTLLAISVFRGWRYRQRRVHLGRRGERTKYVDAWSRYRLQDESGDGGEADSAQ